MGAVKRINPILACLILAENWASELPLLQVARQILRNWCLHDFPHKKLEYDNLRLKNMFLEDKLMSAIVSEALEISD
jgi:type II secretory pathway component PulJ